LRELTLGLYTHRAKPAAGEMKALDSYRRAQYQLAFLDSLVSAGTRPEVAYQASRIQNSVSELSSLLPDLNSPAMRAHAAATLGKLRQLSVDTSVQANCDQAIASIQDDTPAARIGAAGGTPGMALEVSGSEPLHRP
jgi:hypothetical protein